MNQIDGLLNELSERSLAKVTMKYDNIRNQYLLTSNTVGNFDEFSSTIGSYLNLLQGGRLSSFEASARAKQILETHYRRNGGDLVTAYNDAREATNGGVRSLIDIITNSTISEAVELFIRDAFDRYVAPSSWEQKVEIIRQFMSRCGAQLSSSIDVNDPKRYARDYMTLIKAYADAMRRVGRDFRRL